LAIAAFPTDSVFAAAPLELSAGRALVSVSAGDSAGDSAGAGEVGAGEAGALASDGRTGAATGGSGGIPAGTTHIGGRVLAGIHPGPRTPITRDTTIRATVTTSMTIHRRTTDTLEPATTLWEIM